MAMKWALCMLLLLTQHTSAKNNSSKLVDSDEFRQSLDFLMQYMPEIDRSLQGPFITENIELALAARHRHKWAKDVPWELFLNNVLPFANMDEPRDGWRRLFYELFQPIVAQAKSTSEAALLLNRDIWTLWGIYFKPDQTPEIMAPSQVIRWGYASCTGLSIFLVNACRAVGIPARVAGTPAWRDGSTKERFNNHNWVEVWDNGIWSFTGANEYTPLGYNHTWFFPGRTNKQVPGDLMHAIYAVSFKPTQHNRYFPLAWNENDSQVHAEDVTQSYLDAAVTSLQSNVVMKSSGAGMKIRKMVSGQGMQSKVQAS